MSKIKSFFKSIHIIHYIIVFIVLISCAIFFISSLSIFSSANDKVESKLKDDTSSSDLSKNIFLFKESGEILFKSPNSEDYTKVKEEKTVLENDSFVKTENGRGYVIFPDNSSVTLEKNTEIKISYNTKKIDVLQVYGTTYHRVISLLKGTQYEVRTPNTLAAVRGTKFSVTYEKETSKTTVAVTESTVEMTLNADDKANIESKPISSGNFATAISNISNQNMGSVSFGEINTNDSLPKEIKEFIDENKKIDIEFNKVPNENDEKVKFIERLITENNNKDDRNDKDNKDNNVKEVNNNADNDNINIVNEDATILNDTPILKIEDNSKLNNNLNPNLNNQIQAAKSIVPVFLGGSGGITQNNSDNNSNNNSNTSTPDVPINTPVNIGTTTLNIAEVSTSSISVSWISTSTASFYSVSAINITNPAESPFIATTSSTTSSFTFNNLSSGSLYGLEVIGINASGTRVLDAVNSTSTIISSDGDGEETAVVNGYINFDLTTNNSLRFSWGANRENNGVGGGADRTRNNVALYRISLFSCNINPGALIAITFTCESEPVSTSTLNVTEDITGEDLTWTFSSLNPSSYYKVAINGYNDLNQEIFSANSSVVKTYSWIVNYYVAGLNTLVWTQYLFDGDLIEPPVCPNSDNEWSGDWFEDSEAITTPYSTSTPVVTNLNLYRWTVSTTFCD